MFTGNCSFSPSLTILLKDEFKSKRLDQKLSLSLPDYAETVYRELELENLILFAPQIFEATKNGKFTKFTIA